MKLKVRKVTVPKVKEFIDAFAEATDEQKLELLRKFSWTYERVMHILVLDQSLHLSNSNVSTWEETISLVQLLH